MKIFEDKCTKFSLRDCDFIDYEIAQVLVQGESVVNEEKVLEGFLQISNSVYSISISVSELETTGAVRGGGGKWWVGEDGIHHFLN